VGRYWHHDLAWVARRSYGYLAGTSRRPTETV